MARSNCVIYAVRKWICDGGSLVLTKSAWGPWLHVQHLNRSKTLLCDFDPIEPKRRRWFPPLWFVGRERCLPLKVGAR